MEDLTDVDIDEIIDDYYQETDEDYSDSKEFEEDIEDLIELSER